MKFKTLSLLSIIIILNACRSFHYTQKDIEGTYEQLREDSLKSFIDLTFDKTGFSLVDVADYTKRHHDAGKYMCCDTITYGTWKLDNKYGVISLSTPQLSSTYVRGFVNEETKPNTDSVYFFISNPIEKDMGKKHQYIFYKIESYSIGDIDIDLADHEYNTNRIVVANPKHSRIQSFSILAFTTTEYDGRNIAVSPVKTVPYTVNERSANSFKIDIPELTFQYITYLRLKDHLLKIVNKNKIIWDGVSYIRK